MAKVVERVMKLGEGTLSLARPQPPNNAVTNTTANANTTIIRIAIIIPLPTTVATNTNLVSNHDCHIQSFYEYFLQS